MLTNIWTKIANFLPGWKTNLTALALLVINGWNAIAPHIGDVMQLIPDVNTRNIVNAVLAVLVAVFRQMAKSATPTV